MDARARRGFGAIAPLTITLTMIAAPQALAGDGTFGAKTVAGAGGRATAVADFNNDGLQDYASAMAGASNSVSVNLGNGSGAFTGSATPGVGSRARSTSPTASAGASD
jgi:hypothetical protein